MKIAITGTSGLIGSALVSFLEAKKHEVYKLVRGRANLQPREIAWDPSHGVINLELLEGVDTVVHLAGESIRGRWTSHKKNYITQTRVEFTQKLVHDLCRLRKPPAVFVCASAIGYYGNRGDEWLTEESSKGSGFLADVCEAWEKATTEAVKGGIRTVNLRFGMVLSEAGGALKLMLPAFRWGLGGRLGTGLQYMSWVTLFDLLHIIDFVMQDRSIGGPVNVASPYPIQNRDFTKTLSEELGRPAFFSIPAFVIQWVFGQMGEELLLSSARVKPQKLENAGFSFTYPKLEDALIHCLARLASS